MEDIRREHWDKTVVWSSKQRQNIRKHHDGENPAVPSQVNVSFLDVREEALFFQSRQMGRQFHEMKIEEQCDKTQRVDQKTAGNAEERDNDSACRRSDDF